MDLVTASGPTPIVPHGQGLITPWGHGLGYRPDVKEINDHRFAAPRPGLVLPARYSMRAKMPAVGDQLAIGSCTSWASLAAYRWLLIQAGVGDLDGSELAQYAWSRMLEGTLKSDAGAMIRDAVKVLAKRGMAPESAWPYDPEKFALKPTRTVEGLARIHQALTYERVPVDLYAVKTAIAAGFPVIIGISVYQSFEGDQAAASGIVPMPTPGEQLLGGHALLAIGYDDAVRRVEARGSWGPKFGDQGHHWLPYEYAANAQLGGDYWVIRSVEAPR